MAKNKTKIIKNFFIAFKKIKSLDKLYTFNKVLVTIVSPCQVFLYAYILKTAISALENNLGFQEMIIQVLIIISITFPLALYVRIAEDWFYYREEKFYNLLHLEKGLRTLEMDYELLERPETQDAYEKATRRLGSWNGLCGVFNRGLYIIRQTITFLIACGVIMTVNGLLIIFICALALIKMQFERKKSLKEKTLYYDKTPPIWRRIGYTGTISTNIDIAKDLRIYKMNDFINMERKKALDELLVLDKKNHKRNFFFRMAISFIGLLDTALLYGFLVYEVLYHEMTIALFSFMIASVGMLVDALNRIIEQRGYIYSSSLEADDYLSFMNLDYIRKDETEFIEEIETIEFRNVYYSYYMQEGYTLEDVSFTLKKGEKLALVGYNGAGKTTMVKLLTGLYHTTKGNILINGIDINHINRKCLAQLISPVYQDAIIYALSLAGNIAMSHEKKIDYDKIKEVIETVELDKKVESFPEKEKTMLTRDLDDFGISLSGGENQKLSLARAIYKSSSLYILDEPTSAMDALSEYNMYTNFDNLVKGKATIYISHRLSSTKFCDRIILLDKGKITECGTHEELMREETLYKKLFTMQSDYYVRGDNNEKAE